MNHIADAILGKELNITSNNNNQYVRNNTSKALKIPKSRNYRDNLDKPTAACYCQDEFTQTRRFWEKIYLKENIDEDYVKNLDEDLVEVRNGYWKRLIPFYETLHQNLHYYDYHGYEFHPEYDFEIFNYAYNDTCGCANGLIDSTIGTHDFQIKSKIEINLGPHLHTHDLPCDDVNELDCYYKTRQYEPFDLAIENVAKDRCILCYGVGPNLWPIQRDQLMERLTRSNGDKLIHYEDCSPKSGYHKSRNNEVYRCEGGDDKVGVMAFTEANGDTDFNCGFHGWWINSDDVLRYNNDMYPVFTVRVFYFIFVVCLIYTITRPISKQEIFQRIFN